MYIRGGGPLYAIGKRAYNKAYKVRERLACNWDITCKRYAEQVDGRMGL